MTLLKESPHLAPPGGYRPKLTDAELVTLAVMQALLGYISESRWLRHAPRPPSWRPGAPVSETSGPR